MMKGPIAGDAARDELRAVLEAAQSKFHSLIESLSTDELGRPSKNPGWTNQQLLVHMALGFIIVPSLVRLIRFWNLFPPGFSRPFAALLDASTPIFNWINGLGPGLGARIYPGPSLARKYDRTHARIMRILDRTDLTMGMHYPTRWDPLFDGYVTVEKLFRYAPAHFESHLAQLDAG